MHESVSDEYVTLDGLRFHYREWGDANAQPLVLLHGFGSQATSFDHFAAAMTDRCRVLALDQRGHGESDWAESYAAEAMVEDVGRFVAALGLKRLDLLGFSMGGRNALAFAAAHPETVERLVIVDMGPEIVMSGAMRIRSMVSTRDVFDDPAEVFQGAQAYLDAFAPMRVQLEELQSTLRVDVVGGIDAALTPDAQTGYLATHLSSTVAGNRLPTLRVSWVFSRLAGNQFRLVCDHHAFPTPHPALAPSDPKATSAG